MNNQFDNLKLLFNLDPNFIHLSLCNLSPHAKPVRDAINNFRQALDNNPMIYRNKDEYSKRVLNKAAEFLNTDSDKIALTESTTIGITMVVMGIKLNPNDEIITTIHDPYAIQKSVAFKAREAKANINIIRLYENPNTVSITEIVSNLEKAITSKTKVIVLTWVHSNTGVKLPLQKISSMIKSINVTRNYEDKIVVCVDAVHGLGVEYFESIEDYGCDFFIAGCHKWLFGPRGTGLVWGSEFGWSKLLPIFPSFDQEAFLPWRTYQDVGDYCPKARLCNPGGFGAFEHRWALADSFEFLLSLGKKNISDHIKRLSTLSKKSLLDIPGVKLYTPLQTELSAGLVCFDINNMGAEKIASEMFKHKVIIGHPPYRITSARFAPGIANTETEIITACDILKKISALS